MVDGIGWLKGTREPSSGQSSMVALLVLAFFTMAIGVRRAAPVDLAYISAGLAVAALATWVSYADSDRLRSLVADHGEPSVAILAALLILSGIYDPRLAYTGGEWDTTSLSLALSGFWLAVLALVYMGVRSRRVRLRTIAALLVLVTLPVGMLIVAATPRPPIDVWFLHVAAADALAAGENPYTDAVAISVTAPGAAEGVQIVGYPYPPVTAIGYSLGEWLGGDPRWTSVAAWFAVLGSMAAMAIRVDVAARLRVLILVMVAVQPGWPNILEFGWTEPLSLALLALSVMWWSDRPTISALVLGLALASKQYLLLALPLVLFVPGRSSKRRFLIASGMAATTLLPFVVADPAALWQALVVYHIDVPPRPDSSNLVGLLSNLGINWDPPSVLTLAVPLLLAVWLGRKARGIGDLLTGLALALGAFFLLASQAFANYWFLVGGVLAIAAVVGTGRSLTTGGEATGDLKAVPD